MPAEQVFVTACVQVMPGTPHAEEVKEAFKSAAGKTPATIYVLGSLFDHGASKDAIIAYLEALPGRKVLITEGGYASEAERTCGVWHGVHKQVEIQMWGKHFTLEIDPPHYPENTDLLVHAGRRVDSGNSIRVLWVDWQDRFGPGGLNSLYALSVLAEQIGAGMVAVEPDDGR
jgi:hypothetical protein